MFTRILNKRAQILQDLQTEGLPSLWHNSAPVLSPSSQKLAVLEVHKTEPRPVWLDQGGTWLFAHFRRLTGPVAKLAQRAEAVLQQMLIYEQDDERILRDKLRDLATHCRLEAARDNQYASKHQLAALAGVAAAVQRVMGFTPHKEQLMGALALLEGQMAEMATGEGKTLTAAMAAIVAAWRGLPCHVVTANDYLAKRDAELGQTLFAFCHVSAASVDGEMQAPTRRAAYCHDIVYSTAKELLGDYLRDQLALGKLPSRTRFALQMARDYQHDQTVVMQGLYQVIVDEADSVLIDEAVTPLIISAPHPDDMLDQAAREAVLLARQLEKTRDFKIEPALRHIELTPAGRAQLELKIANMSAFWQRFDRVIELVQMALYAIHLLVKDQHYVIEEQKIILVDELTGRLANQRSLSLGMQQILEASENLPISPPSEVSARLSFQRFFRLFKRLGGMTGTAQEAQAEFLKTYRLFTLKIPTHKTSRRQYWPIKVYPDEQSKFRAIAESVNQLLSQNRAVLIGMRSVRSSEALALFIQQSYPQWQARVLHAANHAQESQIVAQAGQPAALTIATNMAGRGTDIALHQQVRAAGGLHVIVAEANDFARIDRQLIGRCARQGDPGSMQRFVAFDEELIRRFLPKKLRQLCLSCHQSNPVLASKLVPWVIGFAQWKAQKLAFRQRQNILKQDIELERSGF